MNDLVAPAFASAGIPVTEEHQGLSRSDGKRPDGLTTIPWQAGKALTWDVTVVCPLAESYVHTAAQDAGALAELAAARKTAKYAALEYALCNERKVSGRGVCSGCGVTRRRR